MARKAAKNKEPLTTAAQPSTSAGAPAEVATFTEQAYRHRSRSRHDRRAVTIAPSANRISPTQPAPAGDLAISALQVEELRRGLTALAPFAALLGNMVPGGAANDEATASGGTGRGELLRAAARPSRAPGRGQ